MKLFGSKATQQLTVTLDGKVVRPGGEPIRAVVHIAGKTACAQAHLAASTFIRCDAAVTRTRRLT